MDFCPPSNLPVGCVLGWICLKDWIVTKLGCYFPNLKDTSEAFLRHGRQLGTDSRILRVARGEEEASWHLAGPPPVVWNSCFHLKRQRKRDVSGGLHHAPLIPEGKLRGTLKPFPRCADCKFSGGCPVFPPMTAVPDPSRLRPRLRWTG